MTRDLYLEKVKDDIHKRKFGIIPKHAKLPITQNEKVQMILAEKKLNKSLRINKHSKEPKHRRR